MDYAVIKTGGKQYKVGSASILEIEKISGNANDSINFSEVLLLVTNGKITVGNPLVKGISIPATIIEQKKGDKIRVSKFKAKSRYRRVTGHRQLLTKVKIGELNGSSAKKSAEKENKPIAKAKQASKVRKTVKKV